jgi:hypothetical protein
MVNRTVWQGSEGLYGLNASAATVDAAALRATAPAGSGSASRSTPTQQICRHLHENDVFMPKHGTRRLRSISP